MRTKVLLITGLDACGKTTLMRRLEAELRNADFVYVPKYRKGDYAENPDLEEACDAVRNLAEKAECGSFTLKAVSLLSAMLLFNRVINFWQNQSCKVLICERHPLIDVPAYAPFYTSGRKYQISEETCLQIEREVGNGLEYILKTYRQWVGNQSGVRALIHLLENVFSKPENMKLSFVQEFFQLLLPDRTYFLEAPFVVLLERLSERKRKEAHEQLAGLKYLNAGFELILKELDESGRELIRVDASSYEKLDALFERLRLEYGAKGN